VQCPHWRGRSYCHPSRRIYLRSRTWFAVHACSLAAPRSHPCLHHSACVQGLDTLHPCAVALARPAERARWAGCADEGALAFPAHATAVRACGDHIGACEQQGQPARPRIARPRGSRRAEGVQCAVSPLITLACLVQCSTHVQCKVLFGAALRAVRDQMSGRASVAVHGPCRVHMEGGQVSVLGVGCGCGSRGSCGGRLASRPSAPPGLCRPRAVCAQKGRQWAEVVARAQVLWCVCRPHREGNWSGLGFGVDAALWCVDVWAIGCAWCVVGACGACAVG